ncbi:BRO family protein [Avibacterium paragallinarum]|uniref:BRO family protein n=1 Tax=Avibacterium paragallinarum TaxID=728 RepID=UPI0039886F7E
MSNQIQFNTFNFHSNEVRVITDPTGEFWFCGTDVCTILGYINAPDALKKHCKQAGIAKRYISYPSGKKEAIFINEPNLYRLIIKSRKPEAEPFEAWVFEEVLPQIRKTGKYSLEQKQLALSEPEKKYTFEFTEYELEQLAWLWFSHKRMNTLLADLYEPLNAIGSTFSGSVYSHAHEYHRHHKESQATMQRLIEPFKQSTKLNWQRVIPKITPTRNYLDF